MPGMPLVRPEQRSDRGQAMPGLRSARRAPADDSEENFTKRYQEFLRLTRPVIAHYQDGTCFLLVTPPLPRMKWRQKLLDHFIRS